MAIGMSHSAMSMVMILGAMAFTLVTLVLYTLAHQMGSAIDRHNLIRDARLQQQAYQRSVAERRRGANADYDTPGSDHGVSGGDPYNVDVLDDAPGTGTAGSISAAGSAPAQRAA